MGGLRIAASLLDACIDAALIEDAHYNTLGIFCDIKFPIAIHKCGEILFKIVLTIEVCAIRQNRRNQNRLRRFAAKFLSGKGEGVDSGMFTNVRFVPHACVNHILCNFDMGPISHVDVTLIPLQLFIEFALCSSSRLQIGLELFNARIGILVIPNRIPNLLQRCCVTGKVFNLVCQNFDLLDLICINIRV